jgi:hypothetical protein
MAAELAAQPVQLLGLELLAALGHELGVRVVDRPRLGALARGDGAPLLEEVVARQEARDVAGGEDDGVVGEAEHALRPESSERLRI